MSAIRIYRAGGAPKPRRHRPTGPGTFPGSGLKSGRAPFLNDDRAGREQIAGAFEDASGDFSVALEHQADRVHIRLSGDLDISNAPELERVIAGLLGSGQQELLLNLDGVEFMDSTGLTTIIRAHHDATGHGQVLKIRYSTAQVHGLFELTGARRHLTFE